MEALALRPLLVAAPRPATWGAALARLVLATIYKRECDEIDAFAREAAGRLRGAASPADVSIILDELQELPEYIRLLRASAKLAWAARWLPQPRDVASQWARLGAPAAHHVALGYAYLDHAFKGRARDLLELGQMDAAPLGSALVYDDSVPLEVAEVAQKASRSMPALVTLGGQVEHRTLSPWLVLDLAERFAEGCRAVLQVVAALSPDQVSEDVLPPQHRLSATAMTSRGAEAFDDLPLQLGLPEDSDE